MPFAFGIRNIATGEVWRANSGKTNWRTAGHAKLAWNSSMTYNYRRPEGVTSSRFDEQELYEVFKYGQDEQANLNRAVALLRCVIHTGVLTSEGYQDLDELEAEICSFINEVQP